MQSAHSASCVVLEVRSVALRRRTPTLGRRRRRRSLLPAVPGESGRSLFRFRRRGRRRKPSFLPFYLAGGEEEEEQFQEESSRRNRFGIRGRRKAIGNAARRRGRRCD